MVTAFLITTLVFFSLNLILNVLTMGFNYGKDQSSAAPAIGVLISLILITFNIVTLVSYL